MIRRLEGEWFVPRLFACLSVAALVGAAVWPWFGHPWQATAGLVCAAVASGWIAHEMCAAVRARRAQARAQKRRLVGAVDVWTLPPPRVSDDPDVALMVRVLATPDRELTA